MAGIVQIVDLDAAAHSWEISPGVVVHGHAFNGEVPGPIIEATVGDSLAVRFTNALPEPAGIYWHGLPGGGGTAEGARRTGVAQPGDSLEYLVDLSDAGTFCYHIPATTAIGQGLYGLLIVRHLEDAAANGERCLIVTAFRLGRGDAEDQEVLLVNGTSEPQLAAAAGQPERWRLFNLTGYELRLLAGTQRCAAMGTGGQYRRGAEAVSPAVAPSDWLDVVLGPYAAGEAVPLEATPQSPGGDRRARSLATLHAVF
jgi:FtsP/CotA-like multicopper oxidase with cupredoxin domain